MEIKNKIIVFLILIAVFIASYSCKKKDDIIHIKFDINYEGRTYEGIGGVSAGASSELLIDYPEPYKSDILDYLFKPKFGASLQQLKVEIGADAVVVGSESSHARNMDELRNPKPEYYQRGYEFWLMKEAQVRNPNMILCALEWAIPAYLSSHWTQENADYIVQFIKGAKDYWNIDMDYISPGKNESSISTDWLKNIFKPTLDKAGYRKVNILAPDDNGSYWQICNEMQTDSLLSSIIDAVGYHYVCGHLPKINYEKNATTENAKKCNVSLWASEDWSMLDGSWGNAHILVGIFNKMYIRDRITAMQIWCPVDGYYDNLGEWTSTGLMKADQPWSGYYEVSPAIWATAHIGQFIEPGWKFIDDACGYLDSASGGNYLTVQNPETGDYSIIIYTDSIRHTVSIEPGDNMSGKNLKVWMSNKVEQFVDKGILKKSGNSFTLELEPNAIYSLTTTSGQKKGVSINSVPVKKSFPKPYSNDFENSNEKTNPKFFADIDGAFEVVKDENTGNKYLEQQITENPIEWSYYSVYKPFAGPLTTLGDKVWSDIEISTDVQLGVKGDAWITSRMLNVAGYSTGYTFKLYHNGYWELLKESRLVLGSGKIAIDPQHWYNLKLNCKGQKIEASIDNKFVKSVTDKGFKNGMIGIGSNWEKVKFDNLNVK